MKSLTSIEISAIVKELQELVDSKVSKIFQPDQTEVVIEFFKSNKGKFLLRIVPGTTLYITTFKKPNPKHIFNFCKFLRKRLTNVFIRKVEQKGFERIVELTFETKEETYHLILEFFSKGNIIFCNSDYKIISALQVQLWKDRKIKAGETYQYPPKSNVDIFNLTEDKFKEIIKESKRDIIARKLAVDIGLGGLYAEELCLRSNLDKDKENPTNEELSRLFNELKKFAELKLNPQLLENDATPFPLLQYEIDETLELNTFNEALNRYYSKFLENKEEEKVETDFEKKLKSQLNILEKQEKQIEELEMASKFNKEKGDLVYQHYITIKEILDTIKQARDKKIPWNEIEEKLKTKEIIVNSKDGLITLELK